MVTSYSLTRLMEEEINALVRAGHYSSKSDVVKDALRHLLKHRVNLRHAAAIELLKEGKISIGKASEIAELSVEELHKLMEHHKIFRETNGDKEELERIKEIK